MKRLLQLAVVFLIVGSAAQQSRADQASLDVQAQTAWDHRDQPGSTEHSVALWEKSVAQDPTKTTLWINLTKAAARATRHAPAADRKKWADRARSFGEKAVAQNPQSAEAYKFYGEALGQWANAHKGVSSLSLVKQAVAALNHSLTLNPQDGYTHMLLAEFYRQAPSMISVGDKKKALEQAQLAVQYSGDHAITHLALARILMDLGKKADAVAQLQAVLALAPPKDAIPETRADQKTAREILKSMGIAPATAPSAPGVTAGACSSTSTPSPTGGLCQPDTH